MIKSLFRNSKDDRSLKAKKNIFVSGFFKVGDTLIYLLLVPLTLGYLNAYEYGIWLTLNSILNWINSFDIGLGNGLRNKLAEAIACDDKILARQYVSTAFVLLMILMIIIVLIGMGLIAMVDWNSLLGISTPVVHLNEIITVSFVFFCLNFVLKFIGNVFQALQVPSAMYIINFGGHLLSLILIYILTLTTNGSLFLVALVYSATPPIVYAACYPVTFNILYRYLAPSLSFFKKSCIKGLLNLSILFFIMQIAGILLYSISNIIISNMFGPSEVTPYNIAQRYFGVIPMLCNIILAPIWSATTDAYAKEEYDWIKGAHRKIVKLLILNVLIFMVLIIISPIVYSLWIGNEVYIPLSISVLSALYNFIFIWSLSYSYMLNGMGKLRIQIITTVFFSLCFYPLSRLLGGMFMVPGIMMAMCIAILTGAILNTIQFNLVIYNKAKGIWLK